MAKMNKEERAYNAGKQAGRKESRKARAKSSAEKEEKRVTRATEKRIAADIRNRNRQWTTEDRNAQKAKDKAAALASKILAKRQADRKKAASKQLQMTGKFVKGRIRALGTGVASTGAGVVRSVAGVHNLAPTGGLHNMRVYEPQPGSPGAHPFVTRGPSPIIRGRGLTDNNPRIRPPLAPRMRLW